MKILVTGSAGHLGEALVRTLHAQNAQVVDECMRGVTPGVHAFMFTSTTSPFGEALTLPAGSSAA